MHCHLVIPALIPPSGLAEEFIAGASAPVLRKLFSRAGVAESLSDSYEAWWCHRFGVTRQNDWPIAPIALAADGGDAAEAYWLRADPVHLQVNRDQLVLADSGEFDIGDEEAAELVAALNAHFAPDDLSFHALRPARWYLRLPAPVDLNCTPLHEAVGKSIDSLLPAGGDARRFRSLCNETQMLLFAHPVNERREAAGQLPINSVWLWGGGTMPRLRPPALAGVWSAEAVSESLARAAGIPWHEPRPDAPTWLSSASGAEEHLVVLDQLRAARQYGNGRAWQQGLAAIEKDWLEALVSALQGGRISRLTLTGFGDDRGVSVTITRGDLRKFWRGSHALTTWLSS